LNGYAVDWKSFKQKIMADSMTEAEYVAASEASKEAVWIKQFLEDLGVVPSALDPVEIYCDNSGAVTQARDHVPTIRQYILNTNINSFDIMLKRVL
jgi:hypothetical protein